MKYINLFIFLFIFSGTVSSQVNGSLNFDGVDDYITFPSGPNLANSSFTIEFWALKDINTDGYVFRLGDVQNTNQYLHVGWSSNTTFNFGFYSNDLQVTIADDGAWHHWVVTYDANEVPGVNNRKIYKDGILVAGLESSSDFIGTATMEIGRGNFSGPPTNFGGSVDILRIWTKALTEAEINDNIGCAINNSNGDLYAEYRFSDGIPNGQNSNNNHLIRSGLPTQTMAEWGTLQNFELNGAFSNWVPDAAVSFAGITEQPQGQNIKSGEDIMLSVTVDLGSCPDAYDLAWYKDGVVIPNSNSPTLAIGNATENDAGEYYLEIENAAFPSLLHSETVRVSVNGYLIATDQKSDYFIDVDWSFPADPCVFDNGGNAYEEITVQILKDDQEIDFTTFDSDDLLGIDVPEEPNFSLVYKSNGDAILTEGVFFNDPFIQGIQDYTVEMWFKPDNGSENLLRFSTNSTVRIDNYSKVSVGGLSLNYGFVPDSWYHFAMVADESSNTSEVFINGLSIGIFNTFDPAKRIVSIGPFFKPDFLLGEFRLWDIKRSPSQIKSNLGSVDVVTTNLVTYYKAISSDAFGDVASFYDGRVQGLAYINNQHTIEPFNYIAAPSPIYTGSSRDFVGPDENHSYEVKLYNSFGSPLFACSQLTDIGSTAPVQVPVDLSVSSDFLDKVLISWKNKSDLATSFKLYRDGVLIHTVSDGIGRDSTFTYYDAFSATNPLSIKSGKEYTYSLKMTSSYVSQSWDYSMGVGKTLDLDFIASDDLDNRVDMSWLALPSALIDKYQITRNNKLFAVRPATDISYVDVNPLFGDSINYELKLIEDDTIRALFLSTGYVAPNGMVTGRVVTKEDQVPVSNVKVKITRLSSGQVDSVMTTPSGLFTFNSVSYGLLDSFEFSAYKQAHSFTYPTKKITLTALKPKYTDAIILDSFSYSTGSNLNEVLSFTVTGDPTKDQVVLDWELATDASSIFIDVVRNGDIIFNSSSLGDLASSYTDLGGTPGAEVEYQVRIYNIIGNSVSIASQDTTLIFPQVSKIPSGNLLLAAELDGGNTTGNISITWTHTSTNIDAYRIYREDSLIVEVPETATSYIDTEAPFSEDLHYTITAIRQLNDLTYETEIPTEASPSPINLGPMPAPINVSAIAIPTDPSVLVQWDPPAGLDVVYNYTGYIVYRNADEIGRVHKSNQLSISDYTGFGLLNSVYSVSLYRATEDGEIESLKTASASVDFPVFTESVDNFNAAQFPNTLGKVTNVLTWAINAGNNFSGVLIRRNGEDLVRLSAIRESFFHVAPVDAGSTYTIYLYTEHNGIEYLSSNFETTFAPLIAESNEPVYPPQNVTASRDLPNHVKLCWEYLDFVDSGFEIYRGQNLIATLPVGARSYYDYDADPLDPSLNYLVKAINGSSVSNLIAANGNIIDPKMVFGTVTDSNTGLGIRNATIMLSERVAAKTDSSGYYSFLLPNDYQSSPPLTLKAFYSFNNSLDQVIQFDENDHYQVDFSTPLPEQYPYGKDAVIRFLDVDIDIYNLTGNVHWQASNGNYDGVEVRRGTDIIATLEKAEGNMCVDSTAVPGIGYTYQIRTYIDDPEKGRVFTSYDVNVNKKIQYPVLAPVVNLTAKALVDQNAVQIQWSHQYDHADSYIVERNGVFVKEVFSGNPFTFTDTTGTAAEQYTYTVRAKIIRNQSYFSTDKNVSITYPSAAQVINFSASAPFRANVAIGNGSFFDYNLNHVLLSWDYEGAALNGFKIYRDDILIVQLPADSTNYKDYSGIPESSHTYSIEAIVQQNSVVNISEKVEYDITFPQLGAPFEMAATPRPAVGDMEISWKYDAPGIDGFKLSIDFYEHIYLDKDVVISDSLLATFIDNDSEPNGFHVYLLFAYSIRNGVEYVSGPNLIVGAFYPPPPAVTCSASDGTYDNAVEITWDYPLDANIDSFQISKTPVGSSNNVIVATVSKGKRRYIETYNSINSNSTFNYFVKPARKLSGIQQTVQNGNYQVYAGNPDLGWPALATVPNTAITGQASSQLGAAVAIDGPWKVVGSPSESNGVIRIYKFENETWVLRHTFVGPSPNGNGSFGTSLAIDGPLLVVGDPGHGSGGFITGRVFMYRLFQDTWYLDHSIYGFPMDVIGESVAIDGTRIVLGRQFSTPSLQFQQSILVFERSSTCGGYANSCSDWAALPVTFDNELEMSPWSLNGDVAVDIEGDIILMGCRFADYNSNQRVGVVMQYEIVLDQVLPRRIIRDEASISSNLSLESFGYQVEIEDSKIAVTSLTAQNSADVKVGKVSLFSFDGVGGSWQKYQTLTSVAPLPLNFYGWGLKWHNDYLCVSETYIGDGDLGSRLYLYKENEFTGQFEIIQSSDPSSNLFRSEFYDSGSPDLYLEGFGLSLDLSDHHIFVGAPGVSETGVVLGTSGAYTFDLFEVSIDNLSASDGTFADTKISWDLGGCEFCPEDYIESFRIYRNGILIGVVDESTSSFIDVSTGLTAGAPAALPGRSYTYEVEAKINASFEYSSSKAVDTGYSKRQGAFSGKVLVLGTSSPVPGVTINLTGIDSTENSILEYTTMTLADGTFVINDIYVGSSNTYILEAVFQDHEFLLLDGDSYLFTPNAFDKSNVLIFDETAYVIGGTVARDASLCNLEGIIVNYYQSINGIETFVDSTKTDENGYYSMVVKPNVQDLTEIRISVDDTQRNIVQADTSYFQYQFAPSDVIFNNFLNFPIAQEANFIDNLTYSVTVLVENTCGNPMADQGISLRIGALDGCFEYTAVTDGFGYVNLNLPPKNYILSVTDIVGVGTTNYENAGTAFLKARPVFLNLLDQHIAAGNNALSTIEPVKFVYHRAVSIAYTTTFDRFLCDNMQDAAIIKQGEEHSIDLSLSENHRLGENCEVSDGYLVIRNSGAQKVIETIYSVNGSFPTYKFVGGEPNLIDPYKLGINIQYYSDSGSLLGEKIIPIIVEGRKQLPGTGVVTDALTDDAGELLMPLLILRDPPGDQSYATIETGSTISKSLVLNSSASGSVGLTTANKFAVVAGGLFIDAEVGGGGETSNGSETDFSITTSETFSTSSSSNAIGRKANVIVGTGLSSLFGLSQVLTFPDDCEVKNETIISEGIGGFTSTFGYTVGFIENLISEFKNDSILVEMDIQGLVRESGIPYTKGEARNYFASKIASWNQMLHYHDVETVPHYVLCSDLSYRNDLSEEGVALYDQWRGGFCEMIGTYQGDDFVMDEFIEWTPSLVSAYNNTIAFTEEIKGYFLDVIDDGDLGLSDKEIADNNLSVTNQFHNTLGNDAKSAEVFDFSGNVEYTKSISAQQSSSTTSATSRFFYLDAALGLFIKSSADAGFGLIIGIFDLEGRIGARVKTDLRYSISKSQAQSNNSNISYTVLDSDPEDQVAFIALQAPLQNQTPYFIRLGGLSSCPAEEALTINQDNAPLHIDNPQLAVIEGGTSTPLPGPKNNVPIGTAALFQLEISQGLPNPTTLTRDATLFLDLASNPNGAIVKIGGSNLNIVSPTFSLPAFGSITQTLTVERPVGTPFYDFKGIRIGIRPACGGAAKYITLDVNFASPCSKVSLTKPFDGLIVNRINPNNPREIIPIEIRDYQSGNTNLSHIQLEYKRIGAGVDWNPVPGGLIQRQALVTNDAGKSLNEPVIFSFEWDITERYNIYPDGKYSIRAVAVCGVNGTEYSNESSITLARSPLLVTGFPEPADGIWTPGDEISSTYSTDLDCGLLNTTEDIQDYLTLIDLNTMMPVPFSYVCQNNKLTLVTDNPMSDYDGHELRVTYKDIKNILGNIAQDVVWPFDVVTENVDWLENEVNITMYENEIKTISTGLFNTTGAIVNGFTLSGNQPWLSASIVNNGDLFTNSFAVEASGLNVDLTFDSNSLTEGSYTTTINVNGPGNRTPSIIVNVKVVKAIPSFPIDPNYTDSMVLVVNWKFLGQLLPSDDINDIIQVYKDGQMRGYAQLQNQGSWYFATIKIFGNASDEDGLLDFVIWNSDESQAYEPIPETSIPFKANSYRGVLTLPEILLVENDNYEFRKRIYVDSANVSGVYDGMTWATAFNKLEDGIADANPSDTIWIASGSYFPAVGDRNASFSIGQTIAILGGFQTGMMSASLRTGSDETLLSGDIGSKLDNLDNSYHVVKITGTGITLDMLTIRDGTANGATENGGIFNAGSGSCLFNVGKLTLKNCMMSNGNASVNGTLIYNAGDIVFDGGQYFIPSVSTISNLYNAPGATFTIKQNVYILKE